MRPIPLIEKVFLPWAERVSILKSSPLSRIGSSTNAANSFFVDRTNTIAITTGYALGKIDLRFLLFYRLPTPTTITAILGHFSSALRAGEGS